MKIRMVRQAATEDCLFNIIAQWCGKGSSRSGRSIHILSAFASGSGVAALAPCFDMFLAKDNLVEIVFGIDRAGTDMEAVQRLYDLQRTHHSALRGYVFNAPSRHGIFHPKLYVHRRGQHMDFVIGSANMTSGGLGSNFESMLLYENVPEASAEAKHVWNIWSMFKNPAPPLAPGYLKSLTAAELSCLREKLPSRQQSDKHAADKKAAALWKPFSHVTYTKSSPLRRRKPIKDSLLHGDYLLMDVLGETRETQMQLPLNVVEGFFNTKRDEKAEVEVAIVGPDGLTQPLRRPLVKSGKSMRRIEVPGIKNLARSLAIVFIRLKGQKKFAYRIIPQDTKNYIDADQLLNRHGQQEKHKQRRYFIGSKKDDVWPKIHTLLQYGERR